ncbi:MAG: glycosyltransferase [Sedimentisphaerales bacterium]|nr:glycosyltransferase [Sedimentisphaerales bacterium]
MRIAFLVKFFPTLSETFILNQITGLIDRGHEVDIFASYRGDTTNMHPDVHKYELLKRTHYSISVPSNIFIRICKAACLTAAGIWKKPIAIVRALNFFKYGREAVSLRLLYKVLAHIDSKPYDIIQCHFGPKGILAAELREVGAITGRIVTTFHGYDVSRYLCDRGNQVYDGLFHKGDLFLAISELGSRNLSDLGCPIQKLKIHHMGIDSQRFAFMPRDVPAEADILILTVARLVEKKGIEYGIRAIAKLKQRYHRIKYKIIGDGPLRKHLQKLVQELGLENTVELVGWRLQDEIINELHSACILLAPSITASNGDKEGVPVVMMEAMATGLPVISTLHSGIPGLVEDGVSGFLVPERDTDALAEKLGYLIEHPDIWSRMGRSGRDQIEGNYDINKLNDKLVSIYQGLIEDDRVHQNN